MAICSRCVSSSQEQPAFICGVGHVCCNNCFNKTVQAGGRPSLFAQCAECLKAYDAVGISVVNQLPITQPLPNRANRCFWRLWLIVLLIALLIAQLGYIYANIAQLHHKTLLIEEKMRASVAQWHN